mgnify:CR=1 FL=1
MRSYEFAEDYRKNDAIRRADVGIGPYKRPPISTAHTQMIRKYPMRNIALTLKYLGTAYHGWQVQKTVTTVGQTLEEAAAAARTQAFTHASMSPISALPPAFRVTASRMRSTRTCRRISS